MSSRLWNPASLSSNSDSSRSGGGFSDTTRDSGLWEPPADYNQFHGEWTDPPHRHDHHHPSSHLHHTQPPRHHNHHHSDQDGDSDGDDSEGNPKSFKRVCVRFAERTSMQGVPYIHVSSAVYAKIGWTIIFLAGLGAMTAHLYLLFSQYYQFGTQTQVTLGFDALSFPAVTVCNVNRIKASKLELATERLQQLVEQIQPSKIADSMQNHREDQSATPDDPASGLEPPPDSPPDPPSQTTAGVQQAPPQDQQQTTVAGQPPGVVGSTTQGAQQADSGGQTPGVTESMTQKAQQTSPGGQPPGDTVSETQNVQQAPPPEQRTTTEGQSPGVTASTTQNAQQTSPQGQLSGSTEPATQSVQQSGSGEQSSGDAATTTQKAQQSGQGGQPQTTATTKDAPATTTESVQQNGPGGQQYTGSTSQSPSSTGSSKSSSDQDANTDGLVTDPNVANGDVGSQPPAGQSTTKPLNNSESNDNGGNSPPPGSGFPNSRQKRSGEGEKVNNVLPSTREKRSVRDFRGVPASTKVLPLSEDGAYSLSRLDEAESSITQRVESEFSMAHRVKRFVEGFEVNSTNNRYTGGSPSKYNVYSGNVSVTKQIEYEVQYIYSLESRETRKTMGHQIEDILISCSFSGFECGPKDFQRRMTSEYGSCYTIEKDSFISIEGGPSDGLELIMYLENSEYLSGVTLSQAGLQVVIHEKGTMANPHHSGIAITASMETFIGLRQVNIFRKSDPYGSCQDKSQYESTDGIKYTRKTCYDMCVAREVISRCGCYDAQKEELNILMFGTNVTRQYCTVDEEIACVTEVSDDFVDGDLKCDCPNPCSETTYNRFMSFRGWPSDDYAAVLAQEMCTRKNSTECDTFLAMDPDTLRSNFVKLVIYFEDLNYEDVTEVPDYELIQFVSDVGGTIGLWIGLSIISFFEVLQFLYEVFHYLCYVRPRVKARARRKAKMRQRKQQIRAAIRFSNPKPRAATGLRSFGKSSAVLKTLTPSSTIDAPDDNYKNTYSNLHSNKI